MKQLRLSNQITNKENDSLDKYLQEIGRISMVTSEEEALLARKIKEGDHIAFEKLTTANLRFVVTVAKQYQNQGLSLGDLINEGNFGLIEAVKRFDETRGFKFISYAVWWIRQYILQSLAAQSRVVRLPYGKISSLIKINKKQSELEQQLERQPTIDELAHVLNTSSKEVLDTLKGSGRHLSMDAPLAREEASSLLDVLPDCSEPNPDIELMRESKDKEVEMALSSLSPKESNILKLYFGLSGERAMTLEEIGDKLGATRERIRQIKEGAILNLRRKTPNGFFNTI